MIVLKRTGSSIIMAIFLCTLLLIPFNVRLGDAVSSPTVIDDLILDLTNPHTDFNITDSGEWGTNYSDQGKGLAVSNPNQIFTIGNCYPTGVTHEVLLAKWNSTANLIWGKTITEVGSSLVHEAAADSHFVYLIGSTPSSSGSDSLVLKVNESGTVSWIQTLDYGDYETARDVAVSEDGSVYVLIAPTGPLPVLVKLGGNGTVIWDRIIDSPEFHSSRQLCISPDGSIYTLTSQYFTKWDEDGTIIWNIEGKFHRIYAAIDGSIYCMTHLDIVVITTDNQLSTLKGSAISTNFYCNISKWSQNGDQLITRKIVVRNEAEIFYTRVVDLVVSPEGDVYSLLSVDQEHLPCILLKLNDDLDESPVWASLLDEFGHAYQMNSIAAVGDGIIYAEGNHNTNLTLLSLRGEASTTLDNSQTMIAIIVTGVVGTILVVALIVMKRLKP